MRSFRGFEKEKRIGTGVEKDVYEHPNDSTKVVAEFKFNEKESTRRLRGRYYLTKILHELLTDNLPDISAATTKPHTIIMEKKELDEGHRMAHLEKIYPSKYFTVAPIREFAEKVSNDPKTKELISKLKKLGISIDGCWVNFGYDKKDNLVYVDSSFQPWSGRKGSKKLYDPEKLKTAIELLEPNRKDRAIKWFERLETLAAEEEAESLKERYMPAE
jgi:hypothetical protein